MNIEPAGEPTRICLYGPTGSGKTTIARHLVRRYDGELIKIAEPLHRFQQMFYDMLQKPVTGQDGELLQFLADKIEREQPGWLGRSATARVHASGRTVVVNDDCRRNSYAALDQAGFVFVRVLTSPERIAQRARPDHTPVNTAHAVEAGFDTFRADHTITNDGTLAQALVQAEEIVERLLERQRVGR
ncbi:AAA family ATPase [Catellatospora tritici]|uniref:AAA family ATPase n=1 Tax=Catellatospora tritici TaxID=2851566 RepID=UPI001C2D8892|nr:AAA family ATPase [Catellatospora tritici]MBV1849562.1 AAA family ATPase [Catellatospora tritici]